MFVRKFLLALFIFCVSSLFAQEMPSNPLPNGTWDFGLGNGAGVGIYSATQSTRLYSAGFRVGRVITDLHGKGWLRGSLEYGFDLVPVYLFRLDRHDTVYGGGVNPVALVWNMAPRKKFAPFMETAVGGIFSTTEVPRGASNFNFNAQGGFGTRIFMNPDTTTEVAVKFLHISNAHMASNNPGFNQIYVTVSYHWLKR
ncbi:MAG TPA: acyloxyacyl hydrolase [Terriglobales bacterium]|nr:acyloxyacyl hydrolase [Terriglobales bacterium]